MNGTNNYLFPPTLLKQETEEEVGHNLVMRPLCLSDYAKGYCALLDQVSNCEDVTEDQFKSRFREFQETKDTYYIVVVEDIEKGKIVTTGSLVVEKKITHSVGKCGHIEDVVVDTSYRGNNLGKRIIDQLVLLGKSVGCYKLILDCNDQNVPFYEKCGFKRKELQMALYFP